MTPQEIEQQADRIRSVWTKTPTAPKPITSEADMEAALGRPLTAQDLPMLAALTLDRWQPVCNRSIPDRQVRRRLLQYIGNPDPCGFHGLSDFSHPDWQLWPELLEQFKQQQANR